MQEIKNTKYFHAWANKRRNRNFITSLPSDDGRTLTWDSGLGTHILEYFQKLYSTSSIQWEDVLGSISSRIPEEIN